MKSKKKITRNMKEMYLWREKVAVLQKTLKQKFYFKVKIEFIDLIS